MAEMDNETERNYEATERQRERFIEAGEVARSRELVGAATLAVGALTLIWGARPGMRLLASTIAHNLHDIASGPHPGGAVVVYARTAGVVLLAVAVGAIVASVLQLRGALRIRPVQMDFSRLDPWPRLREIFAPKAALISIGLACLKMILVGAVCVGAIINVLPAIVMHVPTGVRPAIAALGEVFSTIMGRGLLCLVALGLLDYFIAYRRLEKRMRMTTQEMREEVKQEAGDPRMRSARKRRHQQLLKSRTLHEVPKADVVMVNPTHYAVALLYKADTMRAPVVVAKGADLWAERIRAVARQHAIPVVSQPSLTRQLHRRVAVGGAIPPELYQAVALVLAHVYRLRRRSA